jgi:NhaA family Na+:H+ antiporter
VTTPGPTRFLNPLQAFLRLEAAGGLVLMATTAVALVIANSPLAGLYGALLDLPVSVSAGRFDIAKPLLLWINDGLMAIFFFLIGLELKREILDGELSRADRLGMPACAAVGGMVGPAAVYVALNWSDAAALRGWAIPAATDIAFALGVLSLLGPRVPPALKAFLLSVAIFDDLGAILIIAVFYTADLSGLSLGIAAVLVLLLAVLNRARVTQPVAYLLVGIPLWVALLQSGVHATLAGVVAAMFIPLRVPEAPLRRLEHALHPWVAFGVLPAFALANAGVSLAGLSLRDVTHPVPLGIIGGLFVGKQAGVLALAWVGTKVGVASLPDGLRWGQVYGVALLCGIGFTMSLFIASLAFAQAGTPDTGLDRLGVLLGSAISGLAGYLVLRRTLPYPTTRSAASS